MSKEMVKEKEESEEPLKIQSVEEIPDMNNGILLCKFDNTKGYIISSKYPDFDNLEIEKLISQNAISFGDKIDLSIFKIKNITFYAKKFSIKSDNERGGEELYSLVIYTKDLDVKVEQEDLDGLIEKLMDNQDCVDKQIQSVYSEFFNITPPSQMAFLGKSFKNYIVEGNERIPILEENKIFLDLSKPSTIVIVGKRGSGKSYTVKGILDEMMRNTVDLGIVVIDKIGMYYSLKYPNTNTEEFKFYPEIKPEGFKKQVVVFIPRGRERDVDINTYDALVSLKPSQVTLSTWYHIFDLESTAPQARLLSDILDDLYKIGIKDFSIDDIIDRIEQHQEQLPNVRAALFNKMLWVRKLGIFDNKGLQIEDICRKGICSVIDVSECDKSIAILLVSFFTETLMKNRKREKKRQEYLELGQKIDESKYSAKELPPTVIILEEGHTYLPKSGKSKVQSLEPLVTYIKECRGLGLGLILISQEPGQLNETALTQTDCVIAHRLTARRDIKTVVDIMPGEPYENFELDLKTLNVGEAAVIIDGYLPERVKIRPARTIHKQRTEYTPTSKADKEQIKSGFSISKSKSRELELSNYWNTLEKEKKKQLEQLERAEKLAKRDKELDQKEKDLVKRKQNIEVKNNSKDDELEIELEKLEKESDEEEIEVKEEKIEKKSKILNQEVKEDNDMKSITENFADIMKKIDSLIEKGQYNTAKTRASELKIIIKKIEDKDVRIEYEKRIKDVEKIVNSKLKKLMKQDKVERKDEEQESKFDNMSDKKKAKLEQKDLEKSKQQEDLQERIDNKIYSIFLSNRGNNITLDKLQVITNFSLKSVKESINRLIYDGIIEEVQSDYYTLIKERSKRKLSK